jgi:hypothetical protein
MELRTCQRWYQMPRSKHSLSTAHTHRELSSMIMNAELSAFSQSKCVKYCLIIGMKNVRQHMSQ